MAIRPLPWGAVVLLLAAQTASADHSFDYLYIEANSGTSSGGHVAVRLDETVYHFQNTDGLILLQRDDWPRFRHLYADLDNRDIHLASLSVPAAVQSEAKRHLDLFHLHQKAWLAQLNALERDVQLLQSISEQDELMIQGIGFFTEASPSLQKGAHAPSRLIPDTPPEGIQHQLHSIIQQRKNLRYSDVTVTIDEPSAIHAGQTYSDHWVDLLQNEIALEVTLGKKRLDPTLLMDGGSLPAETDSNDCSAKIWLQKYRSHLQEDATQLLLKPYPGSGLPLLRALARLEALDLSLKTGRLYLIPPSRSSTASTPRNDEYLEDSQARLEQEFRQHLEELRRQTFCTQDVDDLAYHRLELAGLDLMEAAQARAQRTPVGFDHEPGLPDAPAIPTLDQMKNSAIPRAEELALAMETKDRLEGKVREKMHYNLITRNCVTELLKAVYSGFEGNQEPPEFQGHIDPLRSQSFIPFRFFELVLSRYPVQNTTTIPSYRHRRLAELSSRSGNGWEEIREGNTLTGTLYQPRDEDGVFLFFTDQMVWLRPLMGAANLTTALGAMTLGVIGLPIDQGRLIAAGARGVLFSAPELVFWNIRKGSYTEATLRN